MLGAVVSSASASSGGLRLPFPVFASAARRTMQMPLSTRRPLAPPDASASSLAPSESTRRPWLLVGLGNPGKIYQGTRHNVGFEMIDFIAESEGISMSTMRSRALFGKGFICDVPVMLAKPQTFMNASGESVGPIVSYFNVPLNQVLLMYDDLDLPFAKLRLLPKGGHGGHNGMRSVINHLKGSHEFPRLRIGIGRPPGKMDPASFVLRPFNKKEQEELDFAFQRGLEAVRILVEEGLNKSATFVNTAQSQVLNS
ncbi:peptidyl-tRNA hydrolase, mitochondrial-like isoform X2 [Zingiber officinale]|uniref:peptidyl-tRNA hydrolase, mitochondrial-like isoform X2 n=1 Tax=Zingiber officinale TaxID=94328 RepID=UPI001C4D7B6C|nr:peptidyl-tRNA hydrolase, mitochondrial-like isoform X2 [Zingiber officinale]